jgi:hypothetical protein
MPKLKRYKSFAALKSDQNTDKIGGLKDNFMEFEAFLNRLQMEYVNKKKLKTDNGRQFNR